MENVKILDCTLRDGGYVNDWDFGRDNIKKIIKTLKSANIDYIECGFLSDKSTSNSKTLFHNIYDLNDLIDECDTKNLFLMIKFGDYDIKKLPFAKNSFLKGLRLIFKKENIEPAFYEAQYIKSLGYELFINPTFINTYREDEILNLIEKINEISPYAMSIVDSVGSMNEDDLLNIKKIADENLKSDIKLSFHLHNNLQTSFSNSKAILNTNSKREIILDSSLMGMGRGAGNLCVEVISEYLNNKFNKNYQLNSLVKLIDEAIIPIYKTHSWGYSIPYYLCALNNLHPDYAKYLTDNKVPYKFYNDIFKLIPENKKSNFDLSLIENIMGARV